MAQLKKWKCLTASDLKILAMALMLCDHIWATVVPGAQWLTNLGRLAFPIFAFQIAEGYFHTHSFRKYLQRMLVFALIAEVPFNLMVSGSVFFPYDQNVMFTFCISLLLIRLLDLCREKNKWLFAVMIPVTLLLGNVLGFLTMVDYYGFGVMTVILFYLAHDFRFGWLLELVGMYFINVELMGGMTIPMNFFGTVFDVSQQGLAMLALIPIWFYNGSQGYHSKAFQYASYAFYPVHMLVLAVIALYLI